MSFTIDLASTGTARFGSRGSWDATVDGDGKLVIAAMPAPQPLVAMPRARGGVVLLETET